MKQDVDVKRTWGTLLAVVGGIIAVAIGIAVTNDADYLWSLVLVAMMAGQVKAAKAEYPSKPLLLGLVCAMLCVFVGGVVFFVKDADYLWSILLVGWVAEVIA